MVTQEFDFIKAWETREDKNIPLLNVASCSPQGRQGG
jgi:hypothetical protein